MRLRTGGLAAACLISLATALPAAAVSLTASTLDFEGTDLTGLYLPGETMMLGDYRATARVDFGLVDGAGALGLQAPTGSTGQFYFASNDGQLEITRADSVPFQLNSFAAAFVPMNPPSTQLTGIVAIGQQLGGTTATAWWAFPAASNNLNPFTSYTLPSDFTNLVSLTFRACSVIGGDVCTEPTLNNGQFAIDNITLTPVPEPAPAALLTLGAALLALRLRSQTRASR